MSGPFLSQIKYKPPGFQAQAGRRHLTWQKAEKPPLITVPGGRQVASTFWSPHPRCHRKWVTVNLVRSPLKLHLFRNHCVGQPKTKPWTRWGWPGILPTYTFPTPVGSWAEAECYLFTPEIYDFSGLSYRKDVSKRISIRTTSIQVTETPPNPGSKSASPGWNSLLNSHSLSPLHFYLHVSEVPPNSA